MLKRIPAALLVSTFASAISVAMTGCLLPPVRSELHAVNGAGADLPVMISRTPASHLGRSLTASSGLDETETSSSYQSGSFAVTVVTQTVRESALSAMEQIRSKLSRRDDWVQIERVTLRGEVETGFASRRSTRMLDVSASAHRVREAGPNENVPRRESGR
jgi:hypothetical protein